jgi:hypothetical protein
VYPAKGAMGIEVEMSNCGRACEQEKPLVQRGVRGKAGGNGGTLGVQ